MEPNPRPELSVVVPLFNEEANVAELERRLTAVLTGLGLRWEVLLVNDGSLDGTRSLLDALCAQDRRYKALHLTRNFGHQAAVSAGLDHAEGDTVAVLDADLQDPPELLGAMRARWAEGYHVVYGVRRKRKEAWLKRASYWLYYRVLRLSSSLEIPLDAGDFSLMDRRVVLALRALPERNRFVRGIRHWVGFRQVGLAYERDARHAGEVKYTPRKLVRLALDGLIAFSDAPLRLAIYLGMLFALSSFVLAVGFVAIKLTLDVEPRGWTSTVILMLFIGGVQLLTLGIIGEYISRIYDEVKRRPVYLVAQRMNLEAPPSDDA
ncbi:MAG: glycosyltransferase family 2 protein [Candidatus Sericytochromatia bacterium]|nr:glycosyltransferase family 2 protein [Candidatus Sericytochromatia bacterium]